MIDVNSFCFILYMVCFCATLFVDACTKINEERMGVGLEPRYNPETLKNCNIAITCTLIVVSATACVNCIALILWQN